MDAAEGRRIATREMLPSLEGFTGEGKDTNAWKAVEVIQNLGYCMTSSHVEENGRYPKNVPASYDFKEVSENKSWTLEESLSYILRDLTAETSYFTEISFNTCGINMNKDVCFLN